MKKVIFILVVFSCFLFLADHCFGISIIEPQEGAVHYPGDRVIVKVIPGVGEVFKHVFIFVGKLSFSTIDDTPPYELEFVIDPTFVGKDIIVASGKFMNDEIIEAERQFEVVLPSSVKIDDLVVEPQKVYVTKVPANTEGAHIYETENLRVYGKYSDGIKRKITKSSFGTTYTSSNLEIVSVDSEGLVTAQGPGQAKITISNGGKSIEVDVDVENYAKQ